ncbi:MAG: iron-containing alcohol dehydrogenase, partial [Chitinispirillaceae bacterium]|nr:iron-containing alcohol dehydrogenase [Chitinispirillaceae bacterium]
STEAASLGRHALVVTGQSGRRAGSLIESLSGKGVASVRFAVSGEPTVSTVTDALSLARRDKCDMVIGIGGGSVVDCGKAVAALLANGGDPMDYLEVIGGGRRLSRPAVPFIAVPTTAGTGAEATKNAVIASPEHHLKVSLRSPFILPRLAVVDPVLTYSLPPDTTASTGLDALTQCIEAYVSVKAQPATDGFCREGIARAARSLRIACGSGNDASAREDMSLASLFSGCALANSGLGAVHGLASPIGGRFAAPHGTVCALLLPHVMETNVTALHSRCPGSPSLSRYTLLAGLLTGDGAATAADGVAWIKSLCNDLPLPPPGSLGIEPSVFPEIAAAARMASSMKGNPVVLTEKELIGVLDAAF